MRLSLILFLIIKILLPVCGESLHVVYMAQAGYDPRDVEKRGREFSEETGIDVTFRFEEYEDIYELVTGEEGSSGEIDIVLLDNIWTADFASRGILEPVPSAFRSVIENDIISQIYNANVYNGKMWGVPFLANFQLLYTNLDLLKAAGFSSPPETLEDLKHMAIAAKQKGVIEYPVFDSLRSEEVLVCELVWLSGAFGNSWKSAGPVRLNCTENINAVEYLLDLKKEGLLNPYSLTSGEMFAADVFSWGDALFTSNWTFLIGRLLEKEDIHSLPDFNFTVSVLPVSSKSGIDISESSTVSGFQGLAVLEASLNKQHAWDFIKFLSSPDFQRKYLDEFPVWKNVWNEESANSADSFFSVKRNQVQGAKVRPVHPRYQEISAIIQDWVYKILEEKVPVGEAFIQMQLELDGLEL